MNGSRRRRLGAAAALVMVLFTLVGCWPFPQGDYDDLVDMRAHVLDAAEHDTFGLIDLVGGTLAFAHERHSPGTLGFGKLPEPYYRVVSGILPAPGSAVPTDADLERAVTELGYTVTPSRERSGTRLAAVASGTAADGFTTVVLQYLEEDTVTHVDGLTETRAAYYELEVAPVDHYEVSVDDYDRFSALTLEEDEPVWAPETNLLSTP